MAEITDQGEPSTLLGMRIRREPATGAIMLDQAEYIDKVLSDFNMPHCHPVDTPHQPGVHLKLIGCLTWLAHRCRPDIAYITNVLAQFSSNPGISHWRAGQRVLKYLAGTKTHGIRYERQLEDRLVAYADADWASDADTRRSRSGDIILLAGGPVHWQSRRQDPSAVLDPVVPGGDRLPASRPDDRTRRQPRREGLVWLPSDGRSNEGYRGPVPLHQRGSRGRSDCGPQVPVRRDGGRLPDEARPQHFLSPEPDPGRHHRHRYQGVCCWRGRVKQHVQYNQQHMPAARRHALRNSALAAVGSRYVVGDYVATVTSTVPLRKRRALPLLVMAERQATPTPNADDDPLNHLTIDEIDIRLAEAEAKVARQEKIDRLRILQQQLARPPSCPPIPSVPMVAEAHTRSDAGRLPLPKFDGTPDSFTSWIQTAALWLRNRGYANVIGINEDGSPTATTGTTDDPALEAAAREILLVHMLDHKIASALSLFQAGSAAKCWRVLFQAYSPSSLASVVRAIRDLVTIQHTPGESVATYAARVQAAAHRVRATVPTEMLSLTDALVAVLILANASSDLDAVVAGLHNRALDTLPSVSEVVASLTSEEIRIRDVRDRQESFQTANRSSCNTSTRTRGPRRNESCVFHPGSKHTNGECSLQRHIWHRDNNNNNNSNTSSPTSHE